MKMIDGGKSLKEMRAQIEQKYSKYGPPTPTLPVPYQSAKQNTLNGSSI
jgi:hypothetical protein